MKWAIGITIALVAFAVGGELLVQQDPNGEDALHAYHQRLNHMRTRMADREQRLNLYRTLQSRPSSFGETWSGAEQRILADLLRELAFYYAPADTSQSITVHLPGPETIRIPGPAEWMSSEDFDAATNIILFTPQNAVGHLELLFRSEANE